MSIITTCTGNVNLSSSSAKFHAFFVPSNGQPGTDKFLSQAPGDISSQTSVRIVGRSVTNRAISDMAGDEGGRMTRCSYDVAEGSFIKVLVAKRGQWGAASKFACVLLRVRQAAPLNRVHSRLTTNDRATDANKFVEGN